MAGSSFTQESQSDGSVEFKVTPTAIRNSMGGIALAAIVGFYFAFSNASGGTSWLQIAFGALVGYGTHMGIVWWRTRRLNPGGTPRGGAFRIAEGAIVLPSGQRIERADIRDMSEANTSEDARNPSYVLGTDTTKGVFLLATGMDAATALNLRSAVAAQLGLPAQ